MSLCNYKYIYFFNRNFKLKKCRIAFLLAGNTYIEGFKELKCYFFSSKRDARSFA